MTLGHVMVTGAARGIGRVTAERLAANGVSVSLVDRRKEDAVRAAEEIVARGGAAVGIGADLTDPAAVRSAVSEAEEAFGLVRGAFLNAGWAVMRPFSDIDIEQWDKVIDANLKTTFLVAQALVERLVAAGAEGSLVFAGSVTGLYPTNRMAHYAVAKAGVIALCKALARELGNQRIRVNTVCPGTIATEATKVLLDSDGQKAHASSQIPAGRVGTPDDIADAVVFLLSEQSSYINGAVIPVSGGSDGIEWWPMDYTHAGESQWLIS